jgi:geranylgeranyl diphosphate synthase type II
MQTVKVSTELIEKSIQSLSFPEKPANLYEPLRYFLALGGKRIRPTLTLMAAELFGIEREKALPSALAVEIFHNFSLIHDDIMDEAPLRRKQQTVHEKWNLPIAILSGDVLLIKAYQELAKQEAEHVPNLLNCFNQMAVEVCEGQQKDMDFESELEISIPDYIEMIRLKTSVLLGCALQLGAIVANASEENQRLIYDFGVNIGIAFQIQDDILDLYADPDKFGKQIGGDVLSNKKTFLLLKAFELANETQKSELTSLLDTERNQEKVDKIRSIFNELQVKEEARKKMDFYYEQAMISLQKINVEENAKQNLLDLAAYLLHREE